MYVCVCVCKFREEVAAQEREDLRRWREELMNRAEPQEPRLGRWGLVNMPFQGLPPSLAPSQVSLVLLMRSRLRTGAGWRPRPEG